MSNGAEAAALAAIAQAVKASGAIIPLNSEEFQKVPNKAEAPLVVISPPKFFIRRYSYLTSYKGLTFYTSSPQTLMLPGRCEVVTAGRIWIPR